MLVRAFEVNIRDAIGAAIGAVAQHKGMGRAAVEPDVKHVKDLIVIVRVGGVGDKARLGAVFVPAIRAFGFKGLGDARVDRGVTQQEIGVGRQRALFGETGQWHTPCALT